MSRPTALIADDEPLLREALETMLAEAWPELEIVARARNGREAVALFESAQPDICFLDVHMPGLSGVDAARQIDRRAHIVFVTAFDQYALRAFEEGALDYLVKPLEPARLADTVGRLQARMMAAAPATQTSELLAQLEARLRGAPAAEPLRWIRALVGNAVQLIPTEAIDFLQSDEKYTLIAWRDPQGKVAEALVRIALKELVAQLDPQRFVQVHRSAAVNLGSVNQVRRGLNETAEITLHGRPEVLKVSRSYLHHFRQM